MPSPLKADPTRTKILRRAYERKLKSKYNQLMRKLRKLIVEEDSFGLTTKSLTSFVSSATIQVRNLDTIWSGITANEDWQFLEDDEKLKEFETWLEAETGLTVISEDDRYWEEFVEEGYRRGAGRAFQDAHPIMEFLEGAERFIGGKNQFMSSTLNAPESIRKVKLLAASNLELIKGANQAMQNRIKQDLVTGLVQGDNPRVIARRMSKSVDISKKRARLIAQTEIIKAHAEGQLDAMEHMGIEDITAAVEHNTAGDNRVCPQCKPLDGVVLKVKNAHGIIPVHPGCRCGWAPANVGEDRKGQKRSKKAIQTAFDDSIKSTIPKTKRRSLKEARKRSKWKGATIKAEAAPKSLDDVDHISELQK